MWCWADFAMVASEPIAAIDGCKKNGRISIIMLLIVSHVKHGGEESIAAKDKKKVAKDRKNVETPNEGRNALWNALSCLVLFCCRV